MYCKRLTFFVFNLTSYIIAIKKSQSQIFRTIYIGGQQYVWGHKLVGARKNYFKIYGAVKKRSQLESFLFSIFFFEKSTNEVQTFGIANCTTIVKVKEKIINITVISMVRPRHLCMR